MFEEHYTVTKRMNSISETVAFEYGFTLAVALLTE